MRGIEGARTIRLAMTRLGTHLGNGCAVQTHYENHSLKTITCADRLSCPPSSPRGHAGGGSAKRGSVPQKRLYVMNVGLVGWRGMVGSVLMQRMQQEGDFT